MLFSLKTPKMVETVNFILVELESKIAREIASVRLKRVSEGYTFESRGKQHCEPGIGSTFAYYHFGETFLEEPEIPFNEMAQYLFFKETGSPMGVNVVLSLVEGDRLPYSTCPTNERYQRAFLGSADGVGVYLLNSEDILTEELINRLPRYDGRKGYPLWQHPTHRSCLKTVGHNLPSNAVTTSYRHINHEHKSLWCDFSQ